MDLIGRLVRPLRTGVVTSRYPDEVPVLEPAVRGLPQLDADRCREDAVCVSVCPTGALRVDASTWTVDAGRCVFCGACQRACPESAITLGPQVTLAAETPGGLLHVTPLPARVPP